MRNLMRKYLTAGIVAALCTVMSSCIFAWDCFESDGEGECWLRFSGAESVGIKYMAYKPFYTGGERPSDSEVKNVAVYLLGHLTGPDVVKSLASQGIDSILWLRKDLSVAAVWNPLADTVDAANRWLDPAAWVTDTVRRPACGEGVFTEYHHTFTFRPEDIRFETDSTR